MPIDYQNISLVEKYIIDNIDKAIDNRYIKVYYQPVIRTISGYLCGFEGLSRWEDPEKGFLTSLDFVPVLEKYNLIHKLDIFVINEICRNLSSKIDLGDPLVPVSFNLSRLDFLACDIFSEVEKTLKKFNIPRDLICVEITESVFIKNKEIITSAIDKFQNAGYKVWMDDFGSGFSSLNVLKDYSFDEFKIDMAFLSSFNLKSKHIITSTIQMAKKIGITTLAEGVETLEQFNFLRNIGCEKAQGFYFGKPMPYDEAVNNCIKRNIRIETRDWRNYYEATGAIDFNTDRGFAIVEFDGNSIKYIFANDAYLEILKEGQSNSLSDSEDACNGPGAFGNMIRKYLKDICATNVSKSISYTSGASYLKLNSELIAKNENKYMIKAYITNITRDENKDETEFIDNINRNILYLYDSIGYFNLSGDYAGKIKEETLKNNTKFRTINIQNYYENFANNFVYHKDKIPFLEFVDITTLIDRVKLSRNGHIISYFRIKNEDGDYDWTEHIINLVPKTNDDYFIHCVRKIVVDDNVLEALNEKIKNDQIYLDYETNNQYAMDSVLWNNFVTNARIKFFWKDKNRRFLGCSQEFLDYYDLKSVNDILGKTDEDMHWHINNDTYRDVEKEIIETGKSLVNVQGKCIIRGKVHNIMASKFPLYIGNQLGGLFGYFVDLDSKSDNNILFVKNKDLISGLSNSIGFFDTLASLNEEYRLKSEDFVAIKVIIPEFTRISNTYGIELGKELIREIANRLRDIFNVSGEICRLTESLFIVLYKYDSTKEISEVVKKIYDALDSLHQINQKPITIHTSIKYLKCSETLSIDDFVRKVLML